MANAYLTGTAYSSYGELFSGLVEMLVSAGWTYQSSGDGTANYNSSGKVFTGTGAGANGWGNSGAWARVQDPAAVREITVQHDNAGGAIIKYSQLAKFTGGSPAFGTTPTATDERALRGSYSPVWVNSSTGTLYGAAMDSAGYGFWFAVGNSATVTFTASNTTVTWTSHGFSTPVSPSTVAALRFTTSGTLPTEINTSTTYFITSSSFTSNTFTINTSMYSTTGITFTSGAGSGTHTAYTIRAGLMMDPVTSVAEDPDPVVWVIGKENAFLTNLNCHGRISNSTNYSNTSSITYGGTIEGAFATMSPDRSMFLYVQPSGYCCGPAQSTLTISTPLQVITGTGMPVNPFNSKYEALPFFWARLQYSWQGATTTSQLGMKGWSSLARWTGGTATGHRLFGIDTLNSLAWINIGNMWLPWDGSTTPT